MTIASDIDLSEGREPLRERAARTGAALRQAAADAGALAYDGFGRLRERSGGARHLAGKRIRTAGLATVATVRRRPVGVGLAAVLGVAAVAVLASPRLRGQAMDGGARLWNALQRRRGKLRI